MAAGAVGAPGTPGTPDEGGLGAGVSPVVGFPETLGLRRSDPDLDGRVAVDCGMTTRVVPPF